MLMTVRTMREVVEELRRERAEALLELQEFDHAMVAMLPHFVALRGQLRELSKDMAALERKDEKGRLVALRGLVERACRVSESFQQISGAFEQFQSAVIAWGAAEPTDR